MPHPTSAAEALWANEIATIVRPVRLVMPPLAVAALHGKILALMRRAYEEGSGER